jgi:hypothetical protein
MDVVFVKPDVEVNDSIDLRFSSWTDAETLAFVH